MPTQHQATHTPPRGILQDAGELAVLTENEAPTRHRFAYRDGQAIQERMHEEVRHDG